MWISIAFDRDAPSASLAPSRRARSTSIDQSRTLVAFRAVATTRVDAPLARVDIVAAKL